MVDFVGLKTYMQIDRDKLYVDHVAAMPCLDRGCLGGAALCCCWGVPCDGRWKLLRCVPPAALCCVRLPEFDGLCQLFDESRCLKTRLGCFEVELFPCLFDEGCWAGEPFSTEWPVGARIGLDTLFVIPATLIKTRSVLSCGPGK